MNRELRLRFLKALVNVPLRVLDRVVPDFAEANYPQSEILLRVYSRLLRAYQLECAQGTFGAEPDGNFERLLRVSLKLLSRMSERDRYYRAWLGLAFLLAHEEVEHLNLSPKQLKDLCREQWLFDVDFLSDRYVALNKREFVEMALCDYLGNLARMELSSVSLPRIGKKCDGGKTEN